MPRPHSRFDGAGNRLLMLDKAHLSGVSLYKLIFVVLAIVFNVMYTSAGIAAGIDLSLHLIGRMCSTELAHATARQMDYPWNATASDTALPHR
jgi:hypothetical protein